MQAARELCKNPFAMHPILFRIPLPSRPLMIWWALVAGAVIALIYAVVARKNGEKGGAVIAGFVSVGALVAAYVLRTKSFEAAAIPIYSYGVMLGLSLVLGWYITLTLADRDGLPKETMANCYVITAVAAVIGSRILYIVTNLNEFQSLPDAAGQTHFEWAATVAFRRGGLVAYGGFLGGYLGSWAYLAANRIRLMPWADVAVPSLASGLMVTRIGCYLFGCDFGRPLSEDAPSFLKRMGTFPHWAAGTLENGEGSPAYVRHMELFRGKPLAQEIAKANASLPVHPTQIYESLCGLLLLVILLQQRKHQKFRGQIFFTFAFGYGFLRFILELLRDDAERGEYGPTLPEHVLIPGALLLMSLGFTFGMAVAIRDKTMRTLARVVAFIPPVVAFLMLRPASFGTSVSVMLSTSQWIGLLSALICSFFYAQYWEAARNAPKVAMSPASLGDFAASTSEVSAAKEDTDGAEDEDNEDEPEEQEAPRPRAKPGKGLKKKTRPAAAAESNPVPPEADPVKAVTDPATAKVDEGEAVPPKAAG